MKLRCLTIQRSILFILFIALPGLGSMGGAPITPDQTASTRPDEVVAQLTQATQELLDAIAPGDKATIAYHRDPEMDRCSKKNN